MRDEKPRQDLRLNRNYSVGARPSWAQQVAHAKRTSERDCVIFPLLVHQMVTSPCAWKTTPPRRSTVLRPGWPRSATAWLRLRTKQFALRIIKMCSTLPLSREGKLIGNQVFRSGTSVGANYREAYRARSKAEFISKLGDCQKELEETIYWLELLIESDTVKSSKLSLLLREADELMAIFSAIIKSSRRGLS